VCIVNLSEVLGSFGTFVGVGSFGKSWKFWEVLEEVLRN
jgi:hypothetical protein